MVLPIKLDNFAILVENTNYQHEANVITESKSRAQVL